LIAVLRLGESSKVPYLEGSDETLLERF
jgi:hypothetical protein